MWQGVWQGVLQGVRHAVPLENLWTCFDKNKLLDEPPLTRLEVRLAMETTDLCIDTSSSRKGKVLTLLCACATNFFRVPVK